MPFNTWQVVTWQNTALTDCVPSTNKRRHNNDVIFTKMSAPHVTQIKFLQST